MVDRLAEAEAAQDAALLVIAGALMAARGRVRHGIDWPLVADALHEIDARGVITDEVLHTMEHGPRGGD